MNVLSVQGAIFVFHFLVRYRCVPLISATSPHEVRKARATWKKRILCSRLKTSNNPPDTVVCTTEDENYKRPNSTSHPSAVNGCIPLTRGETPHTSNGWTFAARSEVIQMISGYLPSAISTCLASRTDQFYDCGSFLPFD